ncbi:GNAT family N-acetyltransferase [Kitasatospora sp. NPDC057223]|uniref:GNAT family N-acetyltransferase n=1 Tax=Kitasatospora sp. NPDC057223 TaxID=3346055 RepID=UPI003636D865
MDKLSSLEQANDNAAGFWLAQARAHGWEQFQRPEFTAVRCARDSADAHRVVVTRPYADPEVLERDIDNLLKAWSTTQLCLEDPYGRLDLSRFGCVHGLGKAVMVREPLRMADESEARGEGGEPARRVGASAGPEGAGLSSLSGRPQYGRSLTVCGASDADLLAAVERTVVEGFPVAARQPWTRGGMLPADLLHEPGVRGWLARAAGEDAGACLTYDDGAAVGVYWVTTIPRHRSKGVARALLGAALAAHPDRPATLVATLLGEPLYRKLGFVEQGVTRWWGYPAAPGAR